MNTVEDEDIEWISPGRIARSHVTMLDGDPGLGKSTLMADWTARITRGAKFPGESAADPPRPPGGVVFLSAEDHLSQTIKPRLTAAGADLSRVLFLRGVQDQFQTSPRPISFPSDLGRLTLAIHDARATLVVIDPLMTYLDDGIDSYRAQSVHKAMMPLASLAEETQVAIVCLRHLSKVSGGPALYRGSGSIAFAATARIGLLVGHNPDVDGDCVLATHKINAGAKPRSVGYRIIPDEHNPSVGKVQYTGFVNHTADDLAGYIDADEREERALARSWVYGALSQPGGVGAKEVFALAAKESFDKSTVKAALRSIGAIRVRGRDGLRWELAGQGGVPQPQVDDLPLFQHRSIF